MLHLDLFSGIGGFSLACGWAGIETIGFVEIDDYCQKVLQKHWPDVPIVEDIRDVEKIKEIVAHTLGNGKPKLPKYEKQAQGQLVQRGNGITESPAILITAGFPCQPFSVAGKRGSYQDDRYLWPETLAVIEAIRPTWILLENVTGIINLALDTVLSDLEGEGYSYETLIIPACAVNAPHRRDRVWIVAHSQCSRCSTGGYRIPRESDTASGKYSQKGEQDRGRQGIGISKAGENAVADAKQSTSRRGGFAEDIGDSRWRSPTAESEGLRPKDREAHPGDSESGSQDVADAKRREPGEQTESEGGQDTSRGSEEDVADTEGQRLPLRIPHTRSSEEGILRPQQVDWWAVEPELGRVAHGIPNRVDRLKCLGNAIVPQVAYQIIRTIAGMEDD